MLSTCIFMYVHRQTGVFIRRQASRHTDTGRLRQTTDRHRQIDIQTDIQTDIPADRQIVHVLLNLLIT